MNRRRMVMGFVSQAFKIVLVLGGLAYLAQPLHPAFTWLCGGLGILLVWLGMIWLGALLEFLLDDEG